MLKSSILFHFVNMEVDDTYANMSSHAMDLIGGHVDQSEMANPPQLSHLKAWTWLGCDDLFAYMASTSTLMKREKACVCGG